MEYIEIVVIIILNQLIGLVGREFSNGPEDLRFTKDF